MEINLKWLYLIATLIVITLIGLLSYIVLTIIQTPLSQQIFQTTKKACYGELITESLIKENSIYFKCGNLTIKGEIVNVTSIN